MGATCQCQAKKFWIDIGNSAQKRSSVPSNTHNTVMVCILCNSNGIIYWELLPRNTNYNNRILSQTGVIGTEIEEHYRNLDRLRFSHKNVRNYIARPTYEDFLESDWKLLAHPSYFHLFLFMSNLLPSERSTDNNHFKQ